MDNKNQAPTICLLGAAPTTGNLGVTALCYSVLDAMYSRIPGLKMTVFDYGSGGGRTMRFDAHTFRLQGATLSRRLYQQECLWNMRVAGTLGGLWNRSVRSLINADAIIDMSGGDSFTDLYGPRIFRAMTLRKRIAIDSRTPLILGPQTYGPFRAHKANKIASSLVRDARMAWARDVDSFAVLKGLLRESYDSDRHRLGVDSAFLLPARDPGEQLPGALRSWLESSKTDRDMPVVGMNVSGLLMNDPEAAHKQFGFRARYTEIVRGLVERVLSQTDARVVLVPHVEPTGKDKESDVKACEEVLSGVASEHGARVLIAPAMRDPREIKWVIAQCDWFCGTRMHSAIAGLSSGVPTTAIAYSLKTRGVFATCGVADAVLDPRELGTGEVVEGLWGWWERRAELEATLQAGLRNVKQQANEQMDAIARVCRESAQGRMRA